MRRRLVKGVEMILKDEQVLRLRVLKLAPDNTERLSFILSEKHNGIKYQVSWEVMCPCAIDDPLTLDYILKRLQQKLRHIIPGVVE